MNLRTNSIGNDKDELVEFARTLLAATTDVTGEKVEEARGYLRAALDNGKSKFHRAEEETLCEARAALECLRDNPRVLIAARKAFRFHTNPSPKNHMILISSISLALLTKYSTRGLVAKRIAPPVENMKNSC